MPRLNRRTVLGISTLALTSGVAEGPAMALPSGLRVSGLRTAQVRNPIGLEDRIPALSWRLESRRRGVAQKAWRVRVAGSAQALRAGHADIWDSGRVESSASTGVAYGGPPLASRQRVWWQVTLWDDAGHSASSTEEAWWEMGLLEPGDWSGAWLAAESARERADREAGMPAFIAPVPSQGSSRLFRLAFKAEAAGPAVLVLFSSGFLDKVTIDGSPLEMPAHPKESWGGPPAARFSLDLGPGDHILAAEVTPPRDFVPAVTVSIAAQLTIEGPETARINSGWQTALSSPEGWRLPGSSDEGWIAVELATPQPIAPWPPSPAVQMRKAFVSSRPVTRARLYVAALGACEMSVNGRRVSEDRLQSESTDFRKTILYRVYDVGSLLRSGDNVLGALVGDGWYASYMAPTGRYAFGPAPRRMLAQLEIELADGTRQTVKTGDGWTMATSPIVASELYNGETYDARLETPGWDAPGFDDAAWTACWTAEAPTGRLKAQTSPPIRLLQTVRAIARTLPIEGQVVMDFGQNFAGLPRLRVKGPAGATVTLRFAEILKPNGEVDQSNLRAARATDRYILRGDPNGETYVPRFTYHGFRYVQVEGLPSGGVVEAVVLHSDLEETGMLRIANPVIQQLWLNTLWSQRSNFVAIPTDCPQRDERVGWAGDAQVFWDAAAYNMDVAAFTRRYLGDLRDAQSAIGAFPIFAPNPRPGFGASPGWADAGVMLPWICWRRYGDTTVVAEHWEAMTAYVAGVIKDNPDLIWRTVKGPNFGDWLALDAVNPGDETTPKDLVGTAMLKRSLDQLAEMGEAIGKTAEAAALRQTSEATAQAFRAAFVKPDGTIGNGSQAGYIMAIRLALLTSDQKAAAGRHLVADIRRRGTLLSTGFLGTPLSLDALADVGEQSLIYDLLLRTEFPSWGYMVAKGATTIWERWNGDTGDVAMNSFNHYALGAVSGFLYRRIAGIEEIEPGFAAVRIAPILDPRVSTGGADYDSVRGRISTLWTQGAAGRLTFDVAVPANMRAELHLPRPAGLEILESGRPIIGLAGVGGVREVEGVTILNIGSGHYRFVVG